MHNKSVGQLVLVDVKPIHKLAQRTHCKNGHRYTPHNTIIRNRVGAPYRQCRICRDASHERQNEKYRKQRERAVRAAPRYNPVRDGVSACNYSSAHRRCSSLWGSARLYPCIECGKAAEQWAYDGTDPEELSGLQKGYVRVYSRYPEFYMPMCRRCHTKRDEDWRKELKAQFSEFMQWKKLKTG